MPTETVQNATLDALKIPEVKQEMQSVADELDVKSAQPTRPLPVFTRGKDDQKAKKAKETNEKPAGFLAKLQAIPVKAAVAIMVTLMLLGTFCGNRNFAVRNSGAANAQLMAITERLGDMTDKAEAYVKVSQLAGVSGGEVVQVERAIEDAAEALSSNAPTVKQAADNLERAVDALDEAIVAKTGRTAERDAVYNEWQSTHIVPRDFVLYNEAAQAVHDKAGFMPFKFLLGGAFPAVVDLE